MEKRYLIDSNIILEYLSNTLPFDGKILLENIIDKEFNISIINRIEILGHESVNKPIEEFINLANSYGLSKEIETMTIKLRKKKKIKIPDAIIAATCIVNDFILITRNENDFKNIENLKFINPHKINEKPWP